MAKTVVALMDNVDQAHQLVDELIDCGMEQSDIGLMAHSRSLEAGSAAAESANEESAHDSDTASSALKGAGAGVGAVAGRLVGALTHLGVPEEEAQFYAEGVRRGGTLVTVRAMDDGMAETAADIMREFGAVDITQRADQWRQSGWSAPVQSGQDRQAAARASEQASMRPSFQSQLSHEAANQPTYRGPERRQSNAPWTGVERRMAIA